MAPKQIKFYTPLPAMADRRNWRKAKLNVYTALKWKMNGLFKQIITSRNVI